MAVHPAPAGQHHGRCAGPKAQTVVALSMLVHSLSRLLSSIITIASHAISPHARVAGMRPGDRGAVGRGHGVCYLRCGVPDRLHQGEDPLLRAPVWRETIKSANEQWLAITCSISQHDSCVASPQVNDLTRFGGFFCVTFVIGNALGTSQSRLGSPKPPHPGLERISIIDNVFQPTCRSRLTPQRFALFLQSPSRDFT